MGVEAAFHHHGTLNSPGSNWFSDSVQLMFAKIGQLKCTAEQAAGRGGDDNLV